MKPLILGSSIFQFVKRFFLLIIFCIAVFHSIAQTGYHITVHIPGMKDSTCYLANYYGEKQYVKDTAKSDANGNVVFQRSKPLPGGIYIFVYPDKHYFEMIVDKQQQFSMETSWANPIEDMKVTGSTDNELFYDYLKKAIGLQKKAADLDKQMSGAKTKSDSLAIKKQLQQIGDDMDNLKDDYVKNHPETFLATVFRAIPEPVVPKDTPVLANGRKDSTFPYRYFKNHFLDNISFTDHRLLRTPIYGSKIDRYMNQVLPQVPDSIIKEGDVLVAKAQPDTEMYKYLVWYLTYNSETSKIMGMDQVFVHMVETYYLSGKTWWVDTSTMRKMVDRASKIAPNLIGNTAPELALPDTSQKLQVLSKVNAKYTILVFWDPDCSHCQKEIPALKKIYDEWKSKGLQVYAVDIEMEEAKWKKFINDHDLDWINVNDVKHTSNFRQVYDVYSTPTIYILDKNKKIVAKRIGVEQIGDFLEHEEKINGKS